MFSHSIIMDKTCAREKCTHTVRRQPSTLQHMLGCLAEATACLTAASVCYKHGPVSTPLSSPSLHPPLLYASLSVLCLTFITLSVLTQAPGLPPVLALPSFWCKTEPDWGWLLPRRCLCFHLLTICLWIKCVFHVLSHIALVSPLHLSLLHGFLASLLAVIWGFLVQVGSSVLG